MSRSVALRDLTLGALALLCGSSCSTQAAAPPLFATEAPPASGAASEVFSRLEAPAPLESRGWVVGRAGGAMHGLELPGATLWQRRVTGGALAQAGQLVISEQTDVWQAFQAKSGEPLWELPRADARLVGAGDDGQRTILALTSPSGTAGELRVIGRDGVTLSRWSSSESLGSPAAAAGLALIPWADHRVSAVALDTGRELWRSAPLASAPRVERQQHRWFAAGESATALVLGPEQPATPLRPRRAQPGDWLPTAGTLATLTADGSRQAALTAWLGQANASGTALEEVTIVAGRLLYGVAPDSGHLRWAASSSAEVIAASVARGGILLCLADGTVIAVDRAGNLTHLGSLAFKPEVCALDATRWVVSEGPRASEIEAGATSALKQAEGAPEPASLYLVDEIARTGRPVATRYLIELASDTHLPEPLVQRASQRLSEARQGAEHMLEALARHYDFLDDMLRPPPVGALADALAGLEDRRAAPLLAAHLNDPANSAQDVRRAARALDSLASRDEYDDLLTFFTLYRTTAGERELVDAVVYVARAMLRVQADPARRVVARAVEDPLTQPGVKDGLRAIL